MRTAIFFNPRCLKAFKAADMCVVTLAIGFNLLISYFIFFETIAIVPEVHPYAMISIC